MNACKGKGKVWQVSAKMMVTMTEDQIRIMIATMTPGNLMNFLRTCTVLDREQEKKKMREVF